MTKTKPPKPPSRFQWRPFLKQVSRDLLKDIAIREDLPHDVVVSAWLGYDGASEQEIVALEKRLGRRLPPSYRTFLAASNGWRQCGPSILKLWPCAEVRWFREHNQDWIDAYEHPENSGIEIVGPDGQPLKAAPVAAEEYAIYGDEQNPCLFRVQHLQSALEISDIGDSAILLLNPEVVNEEGEWEAWLFANWLPGARRYRSFRELMQGEHESFLTVQKELGPSKSKYGNAAQQAARRGETAKALVMLRELAADEDQLSAVSLAELCAFQGFWDEVVANLGRVILNLGAIQNWESYPGRLLHLLARAGHETGRWQEIDDLAGAAIVAESNRGYDQYHVHVQNAFVVWFENLQAYCRRCGRPPHELTRVYDIPDPVDQLTEAERRSRYEDALGHKNAVRLQEKPSEYANHRFAIAKNMKLDDELIRIYEELPSAFYFNDALDVSRAYMKAGNADAAWEVLRERLHQSVGGLPEQVAPIILLIDEALRPLMTRERCNLVLSTPRGREART